MKAEEADAGALVDCMYCGVEFRVPQPGSVRVALPVLPPDELSPEPKEPPAAQPKEDKPRPEPKEPPAGAPKGNKTGAAGAGSA